MHRLRHFTPFGVLSLFPARVRGLVRPARVLIALAALVSGAVFAPLTAQTRGVGRVAGTVFDSIAGRPLRGAVVQLVSTEDGVNFTRGVTSDAFGEFAIPDVPAGRFVIGFQHAMLDSLGFESPARAIAVREGASTSIDLAIPGPVALRAAVCGAPSSLQTGTLIVGYVREARTGKALDSAAVTGEWLEYSVGRGGITGRRPRRTSMTFPTGWFALCNVPAPGSVMLQASKGIDSTDVIEFEMPKSGFARTELVLQQGGAPTRVTGVITGAAAGQPLAGVQVTMANAPPVRTNARGEFTLQNVPAGTRSIDLRLVGYYPVRRTIAVSDSMPPVALTLATLRSVLDTMKTVANRGLINASAEFNQRRRSMPGRFIGLNEIEQRNPQVTSDLFKAMTGVYIETIQSADTMSAFTSTAAGNELSGTMTEFYITMKGVFAHRCLPLIWMNGAMLRGISAPEVDMLIQPKDLLGVEVYQPGQVPIQFQQAMNGCGAVVIWRR